MRNHPGGSHGNHARPDEKMSRRRGEQGQQRRLTAPQSQAKQAVANAKRRQRDRLEGE